MRREAADGGEQAGDRRERHRIRRRRLEQKRLDHPGGQQRAADADDRAEHDRPRRLAQHRADDLARPRAERQAHADLRRASRHRVGGHAEHADEREDQTEAPEQAQQHHATSRGDHAIAEQRFAGPDAFDEHARPDRLRRLPQLVRQIRRRALDAHHHHHRGRDVVLGRLQREEHLCRIRAWSMPSGPPWRRSRDDADDGPRRLLRPDPRSRGRPRHPAGTTLGRRASLITAPRKPDAYSASVSHRPCFRVAPIVSKYPGRCLKSATPVDSPPGGRTDVTVVPPPSAKLSTRPALVMPGCVRTCCTQRRVVLLVHARRPIQRQHVHRHQTVWR